jgi:hypothetical protein
MARSMKTSSASSVSESGVPDAISSRISDLSDREITTLSSEARSCSPRRRTSLPDIT